MLMSRVRTFTLGAAAVVALLAGGCSSDKTTATSTSAGVSLTTTSAGNSSTTAASTTGPSVTLAVGDTDGVNPGSRMTLTALPATAAPGNITFTITNNGTVDHEVLLIKLEAGQTWDTLPIVDSGGPPVADAVAPDKIDEANSVGEMGGENLKPHESRTFTIDNVAAGKYALVCNLAQHYGMGMRAAFTVG